MKYNAVEKPQGEIQQVTVTVNDLSLPVDRWCQQLTTIATTVALSALSRSVIVA